MAKKRNKKFSKGNMPIKSTKHDKGHVRTINLDKLHHKKPHKSKGTLKKNERLRPDFKNDTFTVPINRSYKTLAHQIKSGTFNKDKAWNHHKEVMKHRAVYEPIQESDKIQHAMIKTFVGANIPVKYTPYHIKGRYTKADKSPVTIRKSSHNNSAKAKSMLVATVPKSSSKSASHKARSGQQSSAKATKVHVSKRKKTPTVKVPMPGLHVPSNAPRAQSSATEKKTNKQLSINTQQSSDAAMPNDPDANVDLMVEQIENGKSLKEVERMGFSSTSNTSKKSNLQREQVPAQSMTSSASMNSVTNNSKESSIKSSFKSIDSSSSSASSNATIQLPHIDSYSVNEAGQIIDTNKVSSKTSISSKASVNSKAPSQSVSDKKFSTHAGGQSSKPKESVSASNVNRSMNDTNRSVVSDSSVHNDESASASSTIAEKSSQSSTASKTEHKSSSTNVDTTSNQAADLSSIFQSAEHPEEHQSSSASVKPHKKHRGLFSRMRTHWGLFKKHFKNSVHESSSVSRKSTTKATSQTGSNTSSSSALSSSSEKHQQISVPAGTKLFKNASAFDGDIKVMSESSESQNKATLSNSKAKDSHESTANAKNNSSSSTANSESSLKIPTLHQSSKGSSKASTGSAKSSSSEKLTIPSLSSKSSLSSSSSSTNSTSSRAKSSVNVKSSSAKAVSQSESKKSSIASSSASTSSAKALSQSKRSLSISESHSVSASQAHSSNSSLADSIKASCQKSFDSYKSQTSQNSVNTQALNRYAKRNAHLINELKSIRQQSQTAQQKYHETDTERKSYSTRADALNKQITSNAKSYSQASTKANNSYAAQLKSNSTSYAKLSKANHSKYYSKLSAVQHQLQVSTSKASAASKNANSFQKKWKQAQKSLNIEKRQNQHKIRHIKTQLTVLKQQKSTGHIAQVRAVRLKKALTQSLHKQVAASGRLKRAQRLVTSERQRADQATAASRKVRTLSNQRVRQAESQNRQLIVVNRNNSKILKMASRNSARYQQLKASNAKAMSKMIGKYKALWNKYQQGQQDIKNAQMNKLKYRKAYSLAHQYQIDNTHGRKKNAKLRQVIKNQMRDNKQNIQHISGTNKLLHQKIDTLQKTIDLQNHQLSTYRAQQVYNKDVKMGINPQDDPAANGKEERAALEGKNVSLNNYQPSHHHFASKPHRPARPKQHREPSRIQRHKERNSMFGLDRIFQLHKKYHDPSYYYKPAEVSDDVKDLIFIRKYTIHLPDGRAMTFQRGAHVPTYGIIPGPTKAKYATRFLIKQQQTIPALKSLVSLLR